MQSILQIFTIDSRLATLLRCERVSFVLILFEIETDAIVNLKLHTTMNELNVTTNKSYNWDDISVGDYNMNHSENFFGTYELLFSARYLFYS